MQERLIEEADDPRLILVRPGLDVAAVPNVGNNP